MRNRYFSFVDRYFVRTFVLLILFVIFFTACTPTNQSLTDLVGGEVTGATINGPIGNSALSFSPSVKDFGTLASNSGSSAQTFTVKNISSSNVVLGAISGATQNFSINSGTCVNHSTLNKNDSCTITVTFAPLTSGQFSTSVSIPYDVAGGSFYSSVSILGAGTTLTSFAGLDSLSNVGVSSMQLNWTNVAGADSYQIYRISSGSAIFTGAISGTSCVAGSCTYVAGGLNPSTSYTFRVRATDVSSVQEQNIVGRTATTLAGSIVISTNSAISYAGDCNTFTVTTKDPSNNPVNMTTTTTAINISATGNGTLYSDAGCLTTTNTADIANGQSSKNFYYRNTTAQAVTLTAALTTYATGTLSRTIYASIPSITLSTVETLPSSVAADNSSTSTMTATLKDQFGNNCANQAVTLTSSRGATDTITTSPATSSAIGVVSFTIKSSTVGNPTLSLTTLGFPLTRKIYFLSHTPLIDYQANLAKSGTAPGDTTVMTWWKDLFQTATTEDLQIFNFPNPNTLWAGNGGSTLVTDPYRLTFNSASSRYLEGTNILNAGGDAFIETWIRPSSASTKGSTILSNGDTSNKGFVLQQSTSEAGKVELKFGSSNIYSDEVLADSPLAYWKLNEKSGLTNNDYIGSLSGTIIGSSTTYNNSGPLTNENTKYIAYSGAETNYTSISNGFTNTVKGDDTHTIEMWIYPTTGAEMVVYDAPSSGYYFIQVGATGGHIFWGVGGTYRNYTATVAPINTWSHLVMVKTGAGDSGDLYLNGVLQTTYTGTIGSTSNVAGSLVFGKYSSAGWPYNGRLAEVAIYNTALSQTRIQAHYNARNRAVCRTTSTLTNSIWSHLAGSFNSTSGAFKLFFNGTQECALTLATPTNLYTGTSSPLAVAAHVPSSGTPTAGTYWSGDIAEVRGSNTSVTTSQAIDNYNAENINYPAFNPTNIGGLRLWFDASDASTLFQSDTCAGASAAITGDVVGCWKDKSGNLLHATQTVAGTKPKLETSSINSIPSVRFGATAVNYLTSVTTNINVRTEFIILKTRGAAQGGWHSFLMQNGSPYFQIYDNGGANWNFYTTGGPFNSGLSTANPQMITLTLGSSLSMRLNGNSSIYNNSTVTSSALNQPFIIGGYSGGYGLNGDISEVLIFDSQLSESDIKRVEAYLNAKYKLY